VAARAQGRCEYCLIHEDDSGFRHEVDHIVSRKHGGESSIANLAYSCAVCNRSKGSDLGALSPAGDLVRLFHPRLQLWSNHFRLEGAVIQPLTEEGGATVRLLRLNHFERVVERRLLQQLGRYSRDE
jgi:hypothetical protein